MEELISIIVPVYNVDRYLSKCLDSLINQSYGNLEIIVVDDGSTDRSAEICDQYAGRDRRIRVLHKKNGGPSSARNAGIERMNGEFVLFVDSDDTLALDAAEQLLELLNRNSHRDEIDIVQFSYLDVEENQPAPKLSRSDTGEFCCTPKSYYERLYALGGTGASACTKLFRASMFSSIRFRDGLLHEDEYLATSLLEKARGILYTEDVFYYRLVRENSVITSSFHPAKMDVFYVSEDRMCFLWKSGYLDLLEQEKTKYFVTLVNYYCMARSGGYKEEARIILHKMQQLLKRASINVDGQYSVIYKGCKISIRILFVYWLTRKLLKKELV